MEDGERKRRQMANGNGNGKISEAREGSALARTPKARVERKVGVKVKGGSPGDRQRAKLGGV